MTDYFCFPLWDLETGENIEPEDLCLSPEITEELLNWAKIYDQILNQDEPIMSAFKSKKELEDFDNQALILAKKLQKELGKHYQILLFSEKLNKMLDNI